MKFATVAILGLSTAACDYEEPSAGKSVDALPSETAGLFTVSMQHDGQSRSAVVYVPTSALGTDAPVMLNFHGYGGEAAWHMEDADMRSQADQEGFVLVYPQGTDLSGGAHWNAAPPGGDNKSSADDIGFTEVLLDSIRLAHSIDDDRIYAVGYSNGGMFAYFLACERSDLIAAAGAVSGTMLDGTCRDGEPISMISIHGTADGVIPYDSDGDFSSAVSAVDYWRDRNGTTEQSTSTETVGGVQVDSSRYTGGEAGTEVEHHRVVGGEHVWFEESTVGTNGKLWDFLSRFDQNGTL
jgi:polyhydroxybutyrate depolymerase